MNERLSRLERYGSNRDEGLLTGGRIKIPGGRSRSRRSSTRTIRRASYQSLLSAEERLEQEDTESEEEEDKDYAPRSTIYPSRKIKLAKFFYAYLIFIFVVLTGMLLWWGSRLSGFMPTWDWLKQLLS